jgi:RNA polymerase sigma-70 factor (ECF subfamily)
LEQDLENIIDGCKNNLPASQKQLYKYCFEQMIRVCLRYHHNADDAAEAYNKAMYSVLTKIGQYKNEGSFLGWVRRIIVNTCLDKVRSQARYSTEALAEKESEDFTTAPEVYNQLSSKEILRMVQELPSATSLVFNLYIMEGFTHEQIAEMLSISKGTSKWHLNNARTILKHRMLNLQKNENYKTA